MKIMLNKVHFPVTTLGHGRRIGIWFQGCSIGCKGCISKDTWTAGPSHQTTVQALLGLCDALAPEDIDGVTISGGEPFEQPEPLSLLLRGLASRRSRQAPPLDLLVYSGFPLSRLQRRFPEILGQVDAVISEPFVATKAPGDRWQGSSNQRLTAFSDLGRARYGQEYEQAGAARIQIGLDDESIWFIGVPGPSDMEMIEQAARERGLRWEDASWRA